MASSSNSSKASTPVVKARQRPSISKKPVDDTEQLLELIELLRATPADAAAAAGATAAAGPPPRSRAHPAPHSTTISNSHSDPALIVPSASVAASPSPAPVVAGTAAPSSSRSKRPRSQEESRLDAFLLRHSKSYEFVGDSYSTLLHHLVEARLLSAEWERQASREHRLRVLRAIRVLSRDPSLQDAFLKYRPLGALAASLRLYVAEYFESEPAYCGESIIEVCSILKRVSSEESQDRRIFDLSFLASLVQMLAARDAQILQAVLVTLVNLSGSPMFVEKAMELPCLEPLLHILDEYTNSSVAAAASAASQTQANANSVAASNASSAAASPANFSQTQSLSANSAGGAAPTRAATAPVSTAAQPTYHFLAAELLDLLSEYHECRQELHLLSGNGIFLRLLHKARENEQMCLPILRCIANQALETESSREIRFLGGIQLLLSILSTHESAAASNPQGHGMGSRDSSRPGGPLHPPAPLASASAPASASSEAMLIGACICLTQLSLDDENAYQIRRAQGVYILGMLFLRGTAATPTHSAPSSASSAVSAFASVPFPSSAASHPPPSTPYSRDVQAHACRALRFLYSVERNRKVFKRLFIAPDLFAEFIDVGHYVHALPAYERVVDLLNEAGPATRSAMLGALEDLRAAGHVVLAGGNGSSNSSSANGGTPSIRGYLVQEVLGKGAFGTVYQVQKENGDKLYAMKELSLKELQKAAGIHSNSGCNSSSGSSSASSSGGSAIDLARQAATEMGKEVDILSQLEHPNIVRYFASFLEGPCVYIVMELVEGSSLLDHINSWLEKKGGTAGGGGGAGSGGGGGGGAGGNNIAGGGGCMAEEAIWPIFIQLCLALCYMHMEKRVVHRDLTPSNIMINDKKVVKIADFGLARQTHGNTVLQSAVGTISFSCPEIIMHESYTDKADIWSLGCVLYQMSTGRPAFSGSNPLTVAQKIVAGSYDPIPASYSPLFHEMVRRLLTVDPHARPDILAVSSLISPLLMAELDRVNISQERLAQQCAHEAEARRRDKDEWNREKQTYRKWMAAANNQHRFQQQPAATPAAAAAAAAAAATHSPPMQGRNGFGAGAGADDAAAIAAAAAANSDAPPSSSPLFRVSSSAVRPTSHDPLTLLLSQLHKLVFVTQLPPKSVRDLKRTVITRYKQALFARRGADAPAILKQELQQVLSGSPSLIHASFELPHLDASALSSPSAAAAAAAGAAGAAHRLTHEEMQIMIEQVLEEAGYYAPTSQTRTDGPERSLRDEH